MSGGVNGPFTPTLSASPATVGECPLAVRLAGIEAGRVSVVRVRISL